MNNKHQLQKYPMNRVLKFKAYELLTGKLVTRRDVLTAGAAGGAGFGLHRILMSVPSDKAKQTASNVVLNAQIFNSEKPGDSFRALGKYIYLTPEKLGGG